MKAESRESAACSEIACQDPFPTEFSKVSFLQMWALAHMTRHGSLRQVGENAAKGWMDALLPVSK